MKTSSKPSPLHYRVEIADLHAHLFRVTLTIEHPQASQRLSLPVWIPGSYLVREFSKHLQNMRARQGARSVALVQLNKNTWEVQCRAGEPVQVSCEVYAFDSSVRTAWLDSQRGFFNGTSLCLRVHGQEHLPHVLELCAPDPKSHACKAAAAWRVATSLEAMDINAQGFGAYHTQHYDELVDSPVEMGEFWQGHFVAAGVEHVLVVSGATPSLDAQRLLKDCQKICEAVIRFWHPTQPSKPSARQPSLTPHTRYVFLLNAVDDGYGGLEHHASTALICSRRDLPRLGQVSFSEGYTTLLGLISHEYFHTWNVKRLRPSGLRQYDYDNENYTELLWFFEGFTSYFDDLLLCRAGVLDAPGYVKLLNKTLNQVEQTPGARVQSVAQASTDAWVKYYRQDENTPNATVNYYTKGALVALCFDLSLRQLGYSLDEVMRWLWQHLPQDTEVRERGIRALTQNDFLRALQTVAQHDFAPELKAWVHGTKNLPVAELLAHFGVRAEQDAAQWAHRLGVRVTEGAQGIVLKMVLRGGIAEQAGFAAHDEWLGVELPASSTHGVQGWRLHKLEDFPLYVGEHRQVTALVSRDRQLLRLPLKLPASASNTPQTTRLSIQDAALLQQWLQCKSQTE